MKILNLTAGFCFTLALSGAASAATVVDTIWFSGHAGLQGKGDALSFYGDDVNVDATGHELNYNGTIGADERIGQYWGGLGVTSGKHDSHLLDSTGQDETIKLSFSQTVTIEKVFFTFNDRYDDFAFSVVDGDDAGTYYGNVDIDGQNFYGSYTFNSDWTGTMFGIGAAGFGDEFKLSGVKFSYHQPPAVPLPAGGVLLIGGLGLLAGLRRRKT